MNTMSRISAMVFSALVTLPLFARAEGDVIVKSGGSLTVKPGASLIVGANNAVDIQSDGKGTIDKNGTIDGNVIVRSGGFLLLCGEITGNLLNSGKVGNCSLRTDALIGTRRTRLSGNDRYSRTGAGQSLAISLAGRGRERFFIAGQNDAYVTDGLRFRMKSADDRLGLRVERISGGRANVTAAFVRGGYLQPMVSPGESVLFQVQVRASSSSLQEKVHRLAADVIAESDTAVSDRVGSQIKQQPSSTSSLKAPRKP
jgi:hypothetical protein